MPKKRLRDWPQHTYAFRAYFPGAVPDVVWQRAKAMRELWNECVAAHEAFLASLPDLSGIEKQPAAVTVDTRQLWQEFVAAYRQAGEVPSVMQMQPQLAIQITTGAEAAQTFKDAVYKTLHGAKGTILYDLCQRRGLELELGCWQYWEVYDQFGKALQACWRGQRGKPKAHHGLDRIYLPHRMESGGVSLEWLWKRVEQPLSEAYAKGQRNALANQQARHAQATIPLGRAQVDLSVVMSEPIPPGAILKRLAISGEQIKPFGKPDDERDARAQWRWSLLVAVELPPGDYFKELPATHRAGGVDFGWRARPDGIRVATVDDGAQAWELVIPYDLATQKQRKFQARLEKRKQPVELIRDWREIWHTLQRKRDEAKDGLKEKLERMDTSEWPEEAQSIAAHLTQVGVGGLRRLRSSLLEADLIISALEIWLARDTELAQRIRNAQIHTQQRRDYLYQLFAYWLAKTFDVIAWEGKLDLKEMAETNGAGIDRYALDNAQKHRQFASIYKLRGKIRQAFHRYQRDLMDAETAYSTQTCAVMVNGEACGAQIKPGAQLILTCEDGHQQDQDRNAARNYRQVAAAEMREVAASGASVDLSQLAGVLRPLS